MVVSILSATVMLIVMLMFLLLKGDAVAGVTVVTESDVMPDGNVVVNCDVVADRDIFPYDDTFADDDTIAHGDVIADGDIIVVVDGDVVVNRDVINGDVVGPDGGAAWAAHFILQQSRVLVPLEEVGGWERWEGWEVQHLQDHAGGPLHHGGGVLCGQGPG